MRTLVVVPTYNEIDNLDALLETLLGLPVSIDVLIVDDGSPDGTGELADAWSAREPRVKVLHRPRKMGLGTAYVAGFTRAMTEAYDAAMEMDADFSHSPAYVPALIEAAKNNDLAIGSRYISGGGTRGWGPHRRLLSQTANLFTRAMLGLDIRDSTAGFRCYRVDALRRIDFTKVLAEGYSFQVEMVCRVLQVGGTVVEIPIVFEERRHGRSKISRAEVLRALGTVIRLARERR